MAMRMMALAMVVGSVVGFSVGNNGACMAKGKAKTHTFVTPRSMPVMMAKGFGSSDKAANKPKAKPKSKGQATRDEAADAYEKNSQAGFPEYSVYARPFGSDDGSWKSIGSVTCPRDKRVADVIYADDTLTALKAALVRTYPKMKADVEKDQLEYGYHLKKFPDEKVTVAMRELPSSGNAVMNWIGGLTSPMNTENYAGKSEE
mmetsp:Transcript_31294/g.82852  ORF Transcript_31294/g.82852 Transcript_31294/m.82852 type:complete len:203 (-) Transcript_31294:433-1041(-)